MYLYIKGMSQSRKNIIGDLEEKAVPLVEHLVKIIMFQETGNLKHWCDELGGFINRVPRLRSSNKFPSKDLIFHAIWDERSKVLDMVMDDVEYTNPKYTPIEYDEDTIRGFCEDYVDWLSGTLSNVGQATVRQCTQIAMNILNKYKQGE